MPEKDSKDYLLPIFEKRIKKLGIESTYGNKENRIAILAFSDSLSLLQQYVNEVYSICSEHKEIDKTYNRILNKAKKLVEGKNISFDFVDATGNFKPIEQQVHVCEEETMRFFKKMVKNFNSILHMPDKDHAFAFFLNKKDDKYIQKFEKLYWYGAETTWTVELAFFMLMKFNEILNSKGFELV